MARSPGPDGDRKKSHASETPPRAAARAARAAGLSSDLSFDEQVEIIGQINRVVAKNKIKITDDTFTFKAKKRGSLIPLLINLGALILTMSAGAVLIRYFDRQEATLITGTARVLTAEAKLMEAFREESEARLSEKDREIARIRERLAGLDEERRRLQLDSDLLLQQREAELRAELERLLEEERGKLLQEGVSDDGIRQQLSDLEARLGEENRARIAALREQSERDLAAKDAELAGLQEQLLQRESELESRFQAETGRLETERSRIEDQLSRLRESRQQEELVFDQLLGRYARVEAELSEGRDAAALRELESLESFLATPAIAALPAVRQRWPLDRFTIDSLRALIAARQSAPPAAETAGEAEALAAASAAAADAERQLAEARAEIQSLSRELRGARAAAEARRALSQRLAALRRRYGEVSRATVSQRLSQEQLLALVETKLRVREAMTSEPMKSRYPDLYAELEEYLDAFAAEQQARAREEALRDVMAVLEGLAARREDLPGLQGGYSTPRGDLFAELLERLSRLLE
jgi:chromosome segregation ATPase